MRINQRSLVVVLCFVIFLLVLGIYYLFQKNNFPITVTSERNDIKLELRNKDLLLETLEEYKFFDKPLSIGVLKFKPKGMIISIVNTPQKLSKVLVGKNKTEMFSVGSRHENGKLHIFLYVAPQINNDRASKEVLSSYLNIELRHHLYLLVTPADSSNPLLQQDNFIKQYEAQLGDKEDILYASYK